MKLGAACSASQFFDNLKSLFNTKRDSITKLTEKHAQRGRAKRAVKVRERAGDSG